MSDIKEIIREVTDWDYPGHIYLLNEAGKLKGYIKKDQDDITWFKKPLSFSKRLRKFKKLKEIDIL
jgi:hypothetical protein